MYGLVNKNPNQPNQRRNTYDAVYNTAGDGGWSENPRNQIKTENTNQPPIQSADKGQRFQDII